MQDYIEIKFIKTFEKLKSLDYKQGDMVKAFEEIIDKNPDEKNKIKVNASEISKMKTYSKVFVERAKFQRKSIEYNEKSEELSRKSRLSNDKFERFIELANIIIEKEGIVPELSNTKLNMHSKIPFDRIKEIASKPNQEITFIDTWILDEGDEFIDLLKLVIANKSTIDVYLAHPHSEVVRLRSKSVGKGIKRTQQYISIYLENVKDYLDELTNEEREKVKIHFYDLLPGGNIYIFKDYIFVGSYLNEHSNRNIFLEISIKHPMAKAYIKYAKSLKKNLQPTDLSTDDFYELVDDNVKTYSIQSNFGLKFFHKKLYKERLLKEFKKHKNNQVNIKIIDTWLNDEIQNSAIEKALSNGIKFEILLTHPNNSGLKMRSRTIRNTTQVIAKQRVIQSILFLKKLNQRYKNQIHLKLHNVLPSSNTYFFDNCVLAGWYLAGEHTYDNFWIESNDSGIIADNLNRNFQNVWNNSETIEINLETFNENNFGIQEVSHINHIVDTYRLISLHSNHKKPVKQVFKILNNKTVLYKYLGNELRGVVLQMNSTGFILFFESSNKELLITINLKSTNNKYHGENTRYEGFIITINRNGVNSNRIYAYKNGNEDNNKLNYEKEFIEEYEWKSPDFAKILGQNFDEAIAYFRNDANLTKGNRPFINFLAKQNKLNKERSGD